MSVATLDQLSNGRTLLGLAASSKTTIEQWHSMDFDRPLRRVRETIEIVREAMDSEHVTYEGDIFSVDNPRTFETVRDDVPIFNAALGSANRRLTGEYADGWLPVHVPRSRFEEYVYEIRESAADAGRDPDEITVAPYIVSCVTEDGEQARDHVRRLLSFYIGAIDYYGGVFRDYGFEAEVEAIRDAWQAGNRGEAADRVTDELLDQVAIAGTPEDGRRMLQRYRDIGADVPIVYPPPAPREAIETTIAELAPE